MNPILFFELSESVLTEGAAFDAITTGTFIDMYGRKATFREKDLPKYVDNTKANIEASITDEGEVVGLPIDAIDHDKGDGAGWIVDVELDAERNVIQLKPNWTSIGIEVIEGKIRRFFSATIDMPNKTILGGTLTNWPAIRDKKGKVLLKPVELSRGLFEFDEESFDESSRRCRSAFYDEFGTGDYESDPWVREVFEGHAIVFFESKDWKVEFKISKDGEYTFKPEEDWTEVRQTWVDAMLDNKIVEKITGIFKTNNKPGSDPEKTLSEDNTMTLKMTQEELDTKIADQVAAALGSALEKEFAGFRNAMTEAINPASPEDEDEPVVGEPPKFNILEMFDLGDQEDAAKVEMAKQINDEFEAYRSQVKNESVLQIKKIRRDSYLTEFATKVTSGNADVPYGVPVEAEALKTWLMSLTPDQTEFAKTMLEGFWKSGRVGFEELGHGKNPEGSKELDEATANGLRDGSLTIADLSNPILGLGDLSQYNLAEFKGE